MATPDLKRTVKELKLQLQEAKDDLAEEKANALDQLQDRIEVVGELQARALPEGWVATRITKGLDEEPGKQGPLWLQCLYRGHYSIERAYEWDLSLRLQFVPAEYYNRPTPTLHGYAPTLQQAVAAAEKAAVEVRECLAVAKQRAKANRTREVQRLAKKRAAKRRP